MHFRIGNGYDIHRLVPGRPLILGGHKIDHPEGLGLDGHSDADVLIHALMDALLGALSLGDIGKYFPPDDPKWKGSKSLLLLEQVVKIIRKKGWDVVNVDLILVLERPKIKPYIQSICTALAHALSIDLDQVSVKATTNEKLGPIGREEGIACYAVVLLSLS
uniref:2-C-methyl-D-erythritol 2,4-cyclodiphosphate synthase n=1 Tax=Paulinella chromatophora TaxID=39717 RepID=B1X3R9_PAUCH|nr:2C-methyl-D-erythritol 2,4-cyclodiphosphate synthase [Paulinella chromatophora]ACB42588.1 2C-methyl-D-erythritol 2,4-cyclodiphosphate synthase [Paulinella chromatophora]